LGCPEGTYNHNDWPGEYPTPVVQVDQTVRVMVRRSPCDETATLKCRVEPGLYHPWAQGADPKGYATVAPTERYLLRTEMRYSEGEGEKTLPKGTEVELLSALAEGQCLMKALGRTFSAHCVPNQAPETYTLLPSRFPESWAHQYVRVACDGQPGWVLLDAEWDAQAGVRQGRVVKYGKVERVPVPCPEDPVAMIQRVYDQYMAAQSKGSRPPQLNNITCWVPSTRRLIMTRPLDFDPVVQGQDVQISDVRITRVTKGAVQAEFVNLKTAQKVLWKLAHQDRWRVVDVLTKEGSLRARLQVQPAVP
jgi:hypothetical protein